MTEKMERKVNDMGYTNSTLVVCTKLSPNHSGQRTHGIDRITPHCTVGQVTAEGLGDWFAKSSTKASSNYGIDKDGRVGMYVEEKNRPWCSSSNANDQRAVTIECASDTAEPYAMNDAVYAKLVLLCIDICRRNGKKKLLWIADRDSALAYEPKQDEMVLTVHRWFANKSCPGEWLYSRLGRLAETVTAELGVEMDPADGKVEHNTEKAIWDFLYQKIGNAYGVAGLMGNLYAESGLKPDNLQNSYNRKLNISDEDYTMLVDGDNYPDFVTDKAGYGLAQWTFWSRKKALLAFAKSAGTSIGDLSMQCRFLMKEMEEGYSGVLSILKNAVSVRQASDAVLLNFERPADQSVSVQAKRAGFGQTYYDRYAGGSVTPFKVRVDITDLNIRKGPGTDYERTGQKTGIGVFTITEVSHGKGATAGWGKLKSGAGYISLDYATRI